MGGFNFIFCVAENFIKTVGFDFIVSNANDFIKNSESSTLSTKNIKTSFLYPTDNKGIGFFPVPFFCILKRQRGPNSSPAFCGAFSLFTGLRGDFFDIRICTERCLIERPAVTKCCSRSLCFLKLLFSVRLLFRVGSFCGVRSTEGTVAGAAEFAFALFGVAVVLCVRIAVLCGIPKLFGARCPFLCKVYAFIAKLIDILFI